MLSAGTNSVASPDDEHALSSRANAISPRANHDGLGVLSSRFCITVILTQPSAQFIVHDSKHSHSRSNREHYMWGLPEQATLPTIQLCRSYDY